MQAVGYPDVEGCNEGTLTLRAATACAFDQPRSVGIARSALRLPAQPENGHMQNVFGVMHICT